MSGYMRLSIKMMIRRYGVDLPHKRKVSTDIGGGEIEVTYELQEPKRGQYTEITPLDTLQGRWGQRLECDYIVTFLPELLTQLTEGDLIYIDNAWVEILDKFDRYTGKNLDYIECHCRRVGT